MMTERQKEEILDLLAELMADDIYAELLREHHIKQHLLGL